MKPFEFWELTPAEFIMIIKAHNKRQEEHTKELLWTTWNTAALIRTDIMPEYNNWMNINKGKPKKQKQTNEDMLNMAKMLNSAFGGEVVYK